MIIILESLRKKGKLVFGEYIVFDAIRDNRGKGIKANDLIKVLKKIAR